MCQQQRRVFYPAWDSSIRSIFDGWLCDTSHGKPHGRALRCRLPPAGTGWEQTAGLPRGWVTTSRDAAPRWHQASPWALQTHRGWAGSGTSLIPSFDLVFINKQPKKKHRHRGVCFPSKLIAPSACLGCSFPSSPSTRIVPPTTAATPACLFVVTQCGLIWFYQRKTWKPLWFFLDLQWGGKCCVLFVGWSTAETASCRLGGGLGRSIG